LLLTPFSVDCCLLFAFLFMATVGPFHPLRLLLFRSLLTTRTYVA
jgi:hypothetical protein